ncbi:MAG TPA: hypothetical protein DEA82_13415 [Flavobacteriaceae bacterium]|nr:hypothetical protein [Flavobacteriaceae bacterium]HBR55117.1 hypothetical protein [Flavobacteriaceae bacterium]|tara:strand:- start:280 stop:924 length:645 start_codon:yes stop_codon:yes gene_type:complete
MRFYAILYVVAYLLFVGTLFILPLFSFEGASILETTIGALGAQKVPGNWFANATVIILSFAVVPLATKQLGSYWKQLAVLYTFCIVFFFTGMYQLAGLDAQQYIFNYTNDALHSLFSVITGFAFCLFCVFFIFILKEKAHRWQTFIVFSLALILPLLMWYLPAYKGILQRVLFLVTFGWLFYALTSYPLKRSNSKASQIRRYNELKKHIQKNEK